MTYRICQKESTGENMGGREGKEKGLKETDIEGERNGSISTADRNRGKEKGLSIEGDRNRGRKGQGLREAGRRERMKQRR